MAILVIPTFAEYRYTEQVTLEGVTYSLAFDWSEIEGVENSWHMDLLTEGGTPIRYGIKLVTDFPLLRHVSHEDYPPGEMILVDMQGDAEPEFEGFGSRWLLMYIESGTVLT